MHPPPAQQADEVLAEGPETDRLEGQRRIGGDQPGDVSHLRIGVEAQDQVGASQLEEVHAVGLDDLPHVEQLAQLVPGGGGPGAGDLVGRLGRSQVVADRADAADAGRDLGHLVVHPALAELLEAPELLHVKERAVHLTRIVQMDGDLGVPLDAGHG